MIGAGLKKLANQQGMTISDGVAYGNMMGFATTLSEGSGYKRIDITTRFPEAEHKNRLQAVINTSNVEKTYRIRELVLGDKVITVIFHDTMGTMKKVEAFVNWFYPLLAQHGATRYNICSECGAEAMGGSWYLIDGVAWRFHESCGQHVADEMKAEVQERNDADTGSYLTGAVGAFLGAIVGAVVWALVLSMGWVIALVGLVIGFLAKKGYELFKGKQGKGKIAILIIAIIFGVLLGTIGPDIFYCVQMVATGEWGDVAYLDIPLVIFYTMLYDSEYLTATLYNGGMGLLFAFLGAFALLRDTGKEISGPKVKKLR